MLRAPSSCGTRAGTSTRSRPTRASALYVRIGLYPNLGVCWYTALVCGPGRPTVAAIDFAAPLPDGAGLDVQTGALDAAHICEQALERFGVTLEALGEAYDEDPSALLRGESGRPQPLALDLRWDTAGTPYAVQARHSL